MTKKSATTPPADPPRVAYHAGPPEIEFAGRRWQRGVEQSVSADQLSAMCARPDFSIFSFAVAGEVFETTEEN